VTPLEDLNRATSNVRYHQIFFFGERAAQLGGRRRAFTNPDGVLGAPRGIDLDAGNSARCPFAVDHCREQVPALQRVSSSRAAACWRLDVAAPDFLNGPEGGADFSD
jgi:hypothetical protein